MREAQEAGRVGRTGKSGDESRLDQIEVRFGRAGLALAGGRVVRCLPLDGPPGRIVAEPMRMVMMTVIVMMVMVIIMM